MIGWDDLDRLEEIRREMLDLISEAEQIVRRCDYSHIKARAEAYWIPAIMNALVPTGGSSSIEETIEDLRDYLMGEY